MSSIDTQVELLYDLAENSANIPFTSSVKVDKDELFRILAELRNTIPEEIEDAKRIVRDCEKYIENAKSEAESIIKQAEFEASRLVSEHEVYKRAVEEGDLIRAKAEEDAENGLYQVTQYVDKLLESAGDSAEEARKIMEYQQNLLTDKFNETADIILQIREDMRGN